MLKPCTMVFPKSFNLPGYSPKNCTPLFRSPVRTSDKRTVSLVKTYQEKTVGLVSLLNLFLANFVHFCAPFLWVFFTIWFEYCDILCADCIDLLFEPNWIVYSHIQNVTVRQLKQSPSVCDFNLQIRCYAKMSKTIFRL